MPFCSTAYARLCSSATDQRQAAGNESVIDGRVSSTLAKYNPQTAAEAKRRVRTALMKRELQDEAVAIERGLKPHIILNVELNDDSDSKTGGYIGLRFATAAMDSRIFGLCES